MNNTSRHLTISLTAALVILFFTQYASLAGTYFKVADEIEAGNVIPYAIVHSPGFSGSGGDLVIDVCVEVTFLEAYKLVGPLQGAIETWNALTPTTGNCQGCH